MNIDALTPEEARARLLSCCGSRRWAETMSALRPFGSPAALREQAARVWDELSPEDWREAFAAHPKIGDRRAAAAENSEQAGIRASSDAAIEELARLNAQYQSRFGYIFIVCATGKSGPEMLEILRARLCNDPESELREAARQQLAITQRRLEKLEQSS
jgi:2-oxo-4-hydroxy-4-carboxy-5-ureidoimidazoline decarboxylase